MLVTGAVFLTALLVESIKYLELYLNKFFEKKIYFIKNNDNSDASNDDQIALVRPLRIPSSLEIVHRQRYFRE